MSWMHDTAAAAVNRATAMILRTFSLSFLRRITDKTANSTAAKTVGMATLKIKAEITFPAVPSSGELK